MKRIKIEETGKGTNWTRTTLKTGKILLQPEGKKYGKGLNIAGTRAKFATGLRGKNLNKPKRIKGKNSTPGDGKKTRPSQGRTPGARAGEAASDGL